MEAKPHAIRFREFIGRIYSSHAEAGIDQPLLEVSPVQANVVFLTVSLQALSGIGQGSSMVVSRLGSFHRQIVYPPWKPA